MKTRFSFVKVGRDYRLTESSLTALIEDCKSAQKGCSQRLIDDVIVTDYVNRAVRYLKHVGVMDCNLCGCKVKVNAHSQSFPNSYKGRPESTHFTIEFTKSGMPYVYAIFRGDAEVKRFQFTFSDGAKENILTIISAGCGVPQC